MRKLAFFSVILALFAVDSGAFGATRGAAVSGNTRTSAARAAAPAVTAPKQTTAARAATARAAMKTSAPAAKNVAAPAVAARAATSGVAARAATKQKAINMGTKVASATENTVVSEECQNAYYGCMDAFCMLDNASGGRCQCSDRNAELDAVLTEIMRLDEQSLAMATEGVERLQMGENAEEIMARAKAAADSVTGKAEASDTGAAGAQKVRALDLSSWRNGALFDDDEEEVFAESSVFAAAEDALATKTGDALHGEAAKLCVAQMPEQCKSSLSFLQLTYTQKIKSDCTAYENSLKQQRSQSAEKLQTAQKALRDAALEIYKSENKYDFGQCVTQFKSCMQTTGECGDDYSGCVADTTILGELYGKSGNRGNKVATTVIKTGQTAITISSASYDILNTKKVMCESVTKQCVNANKKGEVWQQVVKDLAPVIYTAEYNAASNNRMNCISTVVNCVQKVCASKWDEESDNYDACLSDPKSIDNYCSLEYNRCGDTDSETNVRNYVMAKLAALKVDKCTKDVKACLLADERCGEDFAGCVGLDSDTIADLCPDDKLLSCQDRANGGAAAVREYIAQIAQGIALNVDNKFATACQNAAKAAFQRVCGMSGDDESTDNTCAALDTKFTALDESKLTTGFYDGTDLYDVLDQYVKLKGLSFDVPRTADNHISKIFKLKALVRGQMDVSKIMFNAATRLNDSETAVSGVNDVKFSTQEGLHKTEPGDSEYDGYDGDIDALLAEMSRKYDSVIQQIESDATVYNCMHGRTVQGFSATKNAETVGRFGRTGVENARFPNLLDEIKMAVADQVMSAVTSEYRNMYADLEAKPAKLYQELLDFYMSKVEAKEAELDLMNEKICKARITSPDFGVRCGHMNTNAFWSEYDKDFNTCTTYFDNYECDQKKNGGCFFRFGTQHKCSMSKHNCDKGPSGAPGAWCRHSHKKVSSFKMSYVNVDSGEVCKSDGSSDAKCE